jgi:hypothetical protein
MHLLRNSENKNGRIDGLRDAIGDERTHLALKEVYQQLRMLHHSNRALELLKDFLHSERNYIAPASSAIKLVHLLKRDMKTLNENKIILWFDKNIQSSIGKGTNFNSCLICCVG